MAEQLKYNDIKPIENLNEIREIHKSVIQTSNDIIKVYGREIRVETKG